MASLVPFALQLAGFIPTAVNLYSLGTDIIQKDGEDWQPEPMCILLDLAQLKTYPKGTKFRLKKYDLELQSPQAGEKKHILWDNFPPQGAVRWLHGDSYLDLQYVASCILTAASFHPPEKLSKDIDLLNHSIDTIVNLPNIPSITKIYLFVVDGIKQLAVTYNVPIAELGNPILPRDSFENKCLKASYDVLKKTLFEGVPITAEILPLGQKIRGHWNQSHFDNAAEALSNMSKLPWGSKEEIRERTSIINLKERKIAALEHSFKEVKRFFAETSNAASASAPIPIPRSSSQPSSNSGTPLSGSLPRFPANLRESDPTFEDGN